jgi:hypothetical protein
VNKLNKCHQAELGKLSPFLKNTQKSRHFTQSVVAGVICSRKVMRIVDCYSETSDIGPDIVIVETENSGFTLLINKVPSMLVESLQILN